MTLEELNKIKSIIDSGNTENLNELIDYINARLNTNKDKMLEENFISFIKRNLTSEELSNINLDFIMRSAASLKGIYPYDFRVKDFLDTDLIKLESIIGQESLGIIMQVLKKYELDIALEKGKKIK